MPPKMLWIRRTRISSYHFMSLLSALAVVMRLSGLAGAAEYGLQVSIWLAFLLYLIGYVHLAHPLPNWWKHHFADIMVAISWNPLFLYFGFQHPSSALPTMFQLVGVIAHGMIASRAVRYRWGKHPFIASATGLLAVLFLGASLLRLVEPSTFSSFWVALWFAYETVTTLGYGEFVPHTAVGYIVAAILSLLGTGLVAALTGYLGAYVIASVHWNPTRRNFSNEPIAPDNSEILAAIKALAIQVAALEEKLDQLNNQQQK